MDIMSMLLSEEDYERLEKKKQKNEHKYFQLKLKDEFVNETILLGESIAKKYLSKAGIKPTEEILLFLKNKTLEVFNYHLTSFSSKNSSVVFGKTESIFIDYHVKNNVILLNYKFFSENRFSKNNFENELLEQIKINYSTGIKYVTIAYINNLRSRD